MPRIIVLFISLLPLFPYHQTEQFLNKALDFETFQEARAYLSENSMEADQLQFIKPEEISFEQKMEFKLLIRDQNSEESANESKKEFSRKISWITFSAWNYKEIQIFLTNVVDDKEFILADVTDFPINQAEAEAFRGEMGFWLKKGFVAKEKKEYLKAFDFWKKAQDKNRKNWLVENLQYNLVLEGVQFFEKQNKSMDALKLIAPFDSSTEYDIYRLRDKKSAIIERELDTIEALAKNGNYDQALELLTGMPIDFDKVEFKLGQKAREIRNNITRSRLTDAAKQFPSESLREDQIAEWLEKGRKLKENDDFDEALKIFTEIITKFPQHPLADDVRYELGACYYLSYEDTIDTPLYFKSLKARSDTLAAKTTYMIARCYRDREFTELAEYYYHKVANQYPKSRFADDALIILAYDEKDYLRSIHKYQKIIDAYPQGDKAVDAAYKVAELFYRTEQYDRAVSAWKRYLSSYPSIPYYDKEAAFDYLYNCYHYLKNPVEMESLVQQALQENLRSTTNLAGRLARMYYYEFNNKEKAKAVLKLIPLNNWDNEIAALDIFFEKGDFASYFSARYPFKGQQQLPGNLKTAQDYYDHAEKIHRSAPMYDLLTRALQLDPDQALLGKIQYKRGRILYDAYEYREALKIFNSNQIKEPELQLFSQYYKAASHQAIGNTYEMNRILNDICLAAGDNFLCDDALMQLAELEFRSDHIKSYLRKILQKATTGDMAQSAADWLARIYLKLDRNYDSTLYVIDHELPNYSPKFSEDLQYYKKECIYRKGLNLIVTGQFQQAEDYFKTLHARDSEMAIAGLVELSDFLSYEKNNLIKAKTVLKIAETQSPDHPSIKRRR